MAPATGEEKTLVTAGVVTMFLLPIVGFVIGIVLLTKPGRTNDGILILIGSVIVTVIFANLIANN